MSDVTNPDYPDPASEYRWAVLEGANPEGEVVISLHDTSDEAMAALRTLSHLAPTAAARAELFVGTVEDYHELPEPRGGHQPIGAAVTTSASASAYEQSANTSMTDTWDWTLEEHAEAMRDADWIADVTVQDGEVTAWQVNDRDDTRERLTSYIVPAVALCGIHQDGTVEVIGFLSDDGDLAGELADNFDLHGLDTVVAVPATTLHRAAREAWEVELTLGDLANTSRDAPAFAIDGDGRVDELDPLLERSEPGSDVAPTERDMGGLDL